MIDFTPIKGDASMWNRDREDGVVVLDEEDQKEITELLLGHKVVRVDSEHLLLDNGTVVKAIGHEGGCSCSAGDYSLSVLNGVDNIITRVEYDYQPHGDYDDHPEKPHHPDDPADEWTGYYRIFVYAENKQINLIQFDGSDGNGYYGTGFELLVRVAS